MIKHHLPDAHVYAGDSQLYISFKPDSEISQQSAVKAMELCICDIQTWMVADKLMNDGKTEFMIVGTKPQLAKVDINNIKIGSTEIVQAHMVKNLGIWLDSNLNIRTHFRKTCSALYYHINNQAHKEIFK